MRHLWAVCSMLAIPVRPIITIVTSANCLAPLMQNDIDEEIKTIIGKYVNKIPDIKSRYVINDGLSKIINHYFKGKITTLPLYKLSLTIDRNPVKIPWTLDAVEEQQNENVIQRALDEQLDKNVKQRQYKVLMSPSTAVPLLMGIATTTGTTEANEMSEATEASETSEATEATETTEPTTPSTTEAK